MMRASEFIRVVKPYLIVTSSFTWYQAASSGDNLSIASIASFGAAALDGHGVLRSDPADFPRPTSAHSVDAG
jgi:hypothetical protein